MGRKTIVISAVNLRKGGTLTILRECLQFASSRLSEEYRIITLVHKRDLADYPGIEYIEIPWAIKGWGRRLWCEYVTMNKIAKNLQPIELWLSLHDTTPNVRAKKRAVYCHNPFPFYNWKWRELYLSHKIVLFAWFSRWIYRINIKRNFMVIVQQQWIKDRFVKMFGLERNDIIVALPSTPEKSNPCHISASQSWHANKCLFLYASYGDVHKNFETLCEGAHLLERRIGCGKFNAIVTIKGDENKYTEWLYSKWGDPSSEKYTGSIIWAGFLPKEQLYQLYSDADCLVFPSRVETWGLPITEFAATGKPMLLSDLPYAHETSAGCQRVAFFNPEDPADLMEKMEKLVEGDESILQSVPKKPIEPPVAYSWEELFGQLLNA